MNNILGTFVIIAPILAAYTAWMLWVMELLTKKQRVSHKLYLSGICPKHLKPNPIHRSARYGRGYNLLCEDCVPEYDRKEAAKLEELMSYAKKHLNN